MDKPHYESGSVVKLKQATVIPPRSQHRFMLDLSPHNNKFLTNHDETYFFQPLALNDLVQTEGEQDNTGLSVAATVVTLRKNKDGHNSVMIPIQILNTTVDNWTLKEQQPIGVLYRVKDLQQPQDTNVEVERTNTNHTLTNTITQLSGANLTTPTVKEQVFTGLQRLRRACCKLLPLF